MHTEDATRLTAPEAARRLGIDTLDVYMLVFDGVLDGRPDHEGRVRVGEESIRCYLASSDAAAAQR